MIAMAKPEPDYESNARDDDGLTQLEQLGILRMMLNPKRRWNITEDAKAKALAKVQALVSSDSERVAVAAAKVLASMERMNQLDEHKAIDKMLPDAGNSKELAAAMKKTLEQVRNDENYGRLRRAAMLGHSGKPGTNGHGGQSGEVGNGSSPRTG